MWVVWFLAGFVVGAFLPWRNWWEWLKAQFKG